MAVASARSGSDPGERRPWATTGAAGGDGAVVFGDAHGVLVALEAVRADVDDGG